MIELSLLNDEYLALRFPYDSETISKIRELENRRWNPDDKQWEVHIAHLPDILKIFYLHPENIQPEIMDIYQKNWTASTFQIRINNVLCTIQGSSFPIEIIDEVTSFWIQGAEYNPKYAKGTWDGRRHLFNKRDHTFPTGLLPRLIARFKKNEYTYHLIDDRPIPKPSLKIAAPSLPLREYQETVIKKALEYRRGILEMATGSGKTLVAASLISKLKLPTVFFVHTRELLYQTKEYFETHLGCPIGQIGDGKIQIEPITVATIQTVVRALGEKYQFFDEEDQDDLTQVDTARDDIVKLIESAPVVFFDECHHLPADTCYTVAMKTSNAYYRYGLSATPYRADHQDLLIESALGPKIIKINASVLIDQKYLVPPRIKYFNVQSLQNLGNKDYATVYQQHIVQNPHRNKQITHIVQGMVQEGRTVLILVQQVKHGLELYRLIEGSEFIQGNDSTLKRNKVLKRFKSKELKVLIATTLADEGLDVPTLGCVILAGGGKSETRALQRVGRALRPIEEKTEAIIIDFIDEAPYLKEHSMQRLQIFKTEPRFTIEIEGELPLDDTSVSNNYEITPKRKVKSSAKTV